MAINRKHIDKVFDQKFSLFDQKKIVNYFEDRQQNEEAKLVIEEQWNNFEPNTERRPDLDHIFYKLYYTIDNQKDFIQKGRSLFLRVSQIAAILVVGILIAASIYFSNNVNNTKLEATVSQELKAAYGTQSKVVLADDPTVYLNSGSKLTFPQTFKNQAERKVTLDGEGYFEVAKNKEQTFVVQANRLKIKVLGTKFNVDANDDNTSVLVALVEGSVELQDNSGKHDNTSMNLAPNQIATLEIASQKLTKTDVDDLHKYTAWINGRIVFFGDPIQTVVKKLENYRFTGTFINEPFEQVLKVLSMTSQMTFIV